MILQLLFSLRKAKRCTLTWKSGPKQRWLPRKVTRKKSKDLKWTLFVLCHIFFGELSNFQSLGWQACALQDKLKQTEEAPLQRFTESMQAVLAAELLQCCIYDMYVWISQMYIVYRCIYTEMIRRVQLCTYVYTVYSIHLYLHVIIVTYSLLAAVVCVRNIWSPLQRSLA